MSLKHKFDFDPDDPFKNDKLQRKEEANNLTNLVKKYADGFVLAINNEWGAGKTTFLKMWQAHLKLQGVESLYFNAWENDHQTDVLVALLSELKELKDTEKEKFKTLIEKAAPIASSVLTASIKALAKTSGADGIVQAFIDAAAEGSEKLLHTEIDNYASRKDGLKEFKKSLEDYAAAIGGKNPLVFIIDELDRCRPSYAVEVLEQIKHVFSVPGIVFVLAIDKVQLGHAIKGVYGSQEMDDVEYLRRFIDVEFSLPEPNLTDYVEYLYGYYQIKVIIISQANNLTGRRYIENLRSDMSKLSKLFQLNLRQVEKIMMSLKISLSFYTPIIGLSPLVITLMVILRLKNVELYNNLKNRTIPHQDLIDQLGQILPHNFDDNGWTIAILSYAYHNELKYSNPIHEKLIVRDQEGRKKLKIDYGQFDPKEEYLERFERLDNMGDLYDLRMGKILKRIEYSDKYFGRDV